jgi:hypothetical protein
MQDRTGNEIHDPYDQRDQKGSHQHDHGRLLQFGPGRPGHFLQQLLIRLPEIGRDFVHFQILARALGFEPRSKVLETSILTVVLCPYLSSTTEAARKLKAIPKAFGTAFSLYKDIKKLLSIYLLSLT